MSEKLGKPASRNVKRKQTNTRLAQGKLQLAPQGTQSEKYDCSFNGNKIGGGIHNVNEHSKRNEKTLDNSEKLYCQILTN